MANVFYVQIKEQFEEVSKDRMSHIGDYINIFDSTYFLFTNKSAKEVYEFISSDNESSILIMSCTINHGDYYGRANKRVWEWLTEKRSYLQ